MQALDVVPAEFHGAATLLGESIATQLRLSWVDLVLSLESCSGMAGSDEAGAAWGASYEAAARSANLSATNLLNSCSHLGALLDQTAVNYELAESASVSGGAHVAPPVGRFGHDWCDWLDDVATAVEPGVPPPAGWELLFHLIQRAWPDGHQDRLHNAAAAWHRAGDQVQACLDETDEAYLTVYRQTVPESHAAATVVDTVGAQITLLAQGYHAIGDACTEYAQHLDKAHHEIISELRDFAIWTAGIETAGGLLSFVTFGLSEAAAQGTEAIAMARFANYIREAITSLVLAARGTSLAIDAAAARIELVVARVRPILAQHLEQVRIAMASDRGEIVIGKVVPSEVSAGKVAATETGKALTELEDAAAVGPAADTWGDQSTLTDHFTRHGPDFGSTSVEDYARSAAMFFRRAIREKLPTKIDREAGTIRFYDPKTNTFGSYRFDGQTRTFFKPKPKNYWNTQPGDLLNG